jgi:hypothetical protein
MGLLEEPFSLAVGDGRARYYPAHVAIKDRAAHGLRFGLTQGQPWRWLGQGGPVDVRLVDVLAAATLATLDGREVPRGPILSAHALALVTALHHGLLHLTERLGLEQQAALDTVDECQLAALVRPPLRYRTIKNYKLNTPRRVPPPIQVVGNQQTVWLWARTQATAWIGGRPGIAWRSGLSDADIEASGRRLPGRPRRPGGH